MKTQPRIESAASAAAVALLFVSASSALAQVASGDPPQGSRQPVQPVQSVTLPAVSFTAGYDLPALHEFPESPSRGSGLGRAGDGGIVIPAGRTMASELRRETLRSRGVAVYGMIPEELPEILDDDAVRHQRSRAAQHIIGNVMGYAVTDAMFDGRRGHSVTSTSVRHETTTVRKGFAVDATPEWTFRKTGPRSGIRVGVPLTPDR